MEHFHSLFIILEGAEPKDGPKLLSNASAGQAYITLSVHYWYQAMLVQAIDVSCTWCKPVRVLSDKTHIGIIARGLGGHQ